MRNADCESWNGAEAQGTNEVSAAIRLISSLRFHVSLLLLDRRGIVSGILISRSYVIINAPAITGMDHNGL